MLQPQGQNARAIFQIYQHESLNIKCEDDAEDTRIVHQFNLAVDEIETLEKKLFRPHGCQRVAVSELGGVGKGKIALELAYRIKSQRPKYSIFWVRSIQNR